MSCGDIKFLEGGALQDVNMIGGSVNSAAISNSGLIGCDITQLHMIDAHSTETIAAALASLSPAHLAALADALEAARRCSHCDGPQIPIPPVFIGDSSEDDEDEEDDDDGKCSCDCCKDDDD